MSTILIDFFHGRIYSDRQATDTYNDGRIELTTTTKVFKVSNKVIGWVGNGDAFDGIDLYTLPTELPKPCKELENTVIFVILDYTESSTNFVEYRVEKEDKWYYLKPKYRWVSDHRSIKNMEGRAFTYGSGGEYAYAGFMAKLNGLASVELAAQCDPYTNTGIDIIDLKEVFSK